MSKVKNRSVIRRFAIREMRSDRKMNVVVIVSIMLTCIMFTALTSIGGSLINGMQQETMRQVGGDRMAGLKCVLPEDYEKVKADGAVRDIVYRIIVGWAENDKLKNISAEINCAGDEKAAKAEFCDPTTGKLPESLDEIAVSTVVLDELDLPHELGVKVPLKLNIDGNVTEHEFTLCGYWQGDNAAMAHLCWVSRAFADKYAPTPAESFYTQEHKKYAGYWQVDFNYANSFDIEGKTDALLHRLYGGVNPPDVGINWAYTTSYVDGGSLAVIIIMISVIFAAGYLIIYNIFHISITSKIRSYGLLKTIGTTSKQIRRIVRIQAAVYCTIGIPCGLIIGVFLSRFMIKAVVSLLSVYSAASYTVSARLLIAICLVSAVFTFATVMISCHQPCVIAGNVSPIEALRYNETKVTAKHKSRKTGKVTPLSIARSNMLRSRKKTVVVVLSLTLSLVIVNTLFTILGGIDEDKYIANSIVGDIIIRHTDKTNLMDDRTKGVTMEMISDLESIDGADVHPVYYDSGTIVPEQKQLDDIDLLYEKYNQNEAVAIELEAAQSGRYTASIYGVDNAAASYFEPTEGSIDSEKLSSGKYAAVHTYLWQADDDSDVEIYHVGDKITVECGDVKREYEVMAVCSVPYPLSTKIYNIFSTEVIVSSDEYMSLIAEPAATCVMVNTDDSSGTAKAQCRAYCDREGSPLVYSDKQTYLDEFDDLLKMIKLLGGTLTGILAMIGILNFVNAVVTGIISRKRELAMMNAVGMTGRQMRSMLMWEGVHYVALTAVLSAAGAALLSLGIAFGIAKDLFFYTYRFTLTPIAVCIPILILLSAAVPFAAYRLICVESVVERLREN